VPTVKLNGNRKNNTLAMIWIILVLLLLACITLPGIWVKRVLRQYSEPADRYRDQGSGAELARHLLDRFELSKVKVEETDAGDHYDPQAKAVRLSSGNYSGYSLTAITVATHEVGHAIQDARNEVLFNMRQRLVHAAIKGERVGSILLIAAPIIMLVTRVPQAGLLAVLIAIGSMALGTLVHLMTLPVEFDASFSKALPLLEEGGYLHEGDQPHARRILKAAALTYVAGSLASLLNLGRWLMVLRR
jgi:Zn-dependent membrane protease YugP